MHGHKHFATISCLIFTASNILTVSNILTASSILIQFLTTAASNILLELVHDTVEKRFKVRHSVSGASYFVENDLFGDDGVDGRQSERNSKFC